MVCIADQTVMGVDPASHVDFSTLTDPEGYMLMGRLVARSSASSASQSLSRIAGAEVSRTG